MRQRSSLLIAAVIGVIIAGWVVNHPVQPVQASGLIVGGFPSVVKTIALTNQVSNAGGTLYNVPSTGIYRITAYCAVTTPGTTSTLPGTTFSFVSLGTTFSGAYLSQSSTANNASAQSVGPNYYGPSAGISGGGPASVFAADAGSAITYTQSGYASTGTAMRFSLTIILERLQ